MRKFKKWMIVGTTPLVIMAVGVPVAAESSMTSTGQTTTSTTSSETQKAEAAKKLAADKAKVAADRAKLEKDKNKLKEDKLKVCQQREANIDKTMDRIASRGQQRYNEITAIAQRTEKFYTDKGKTLANYDQLVAAVNVKKVAAQAAIDDVKAAKTGFKCDGSDPKGAAASFKTKVQAMDSALKDYRMAVKNLIVGVKSVQGSTTSEGSH